ncbi:MAG: CIA30 family protein [Bryobacteraceae bacterium]|jgi:beta-glucosidase
MPRRHRNLFVLAFLSLILLFAFHASSQPATTAQPAPKYRDPKLTIDERVADLLSRMTLEEKVAEICGGDPANASLIDTTGTYKPDQANLAFHGLYDDDSTYTPRQAAILRNAVQRYFREKTRLGIPWLFMSEALHGFMANGSTSFPLTLSLASTFDPALVRRVFTAAGDEARSAGVAQVFTPVLDIARDPRWGRTEETYGEDPYLVSRMAVAAITGLQGDDFHIDNHHVMATAKHFAVHGQPEGGTNAAPGNYSERIIRENFLVPFQAAVQEAHVGSIMASYNEIDGIPSHINHWLLGRVLRQEWGFGGYITSDGDGLQMLVETHHVAANMSEAARLALATGVDFDLSDGSVYRTLIDQVKDGAVPESLVDRAAGRLLAAKFRLGLFEDPYTDPAYTEKITSGPEHRKLAIEAAQKAVVLLKNTGNLLPLDLGKLKTIAVIGPNAADVHIGGYAREPGHGVSILDGIRERVGSSAKVVYAEGCQITTAKQGWRGWLANNVKLADPQAQVEKVAAATELARKADVAILVVGENESTNREAWGEYHLGDRDSLDLLGAQNDLVKSVVETGTPTVVLLINGRPLSINYIAEHVPAILEGWYLGQEGGTAAANVLFGDVNPGGKLPITFPHTVGALPDFYNHKPTDDRTYAFSTRKPLYPFGYGLSYTTFKFENLRVEPAQIEIGGVAKASVDVTNTGSREGDEVPQLYLHQRVASVTQPVMQLKGFERITLKPGEKRTVEFTINSAMLSILNTDMHRVVEPGIFDVMVGPSSADTKKVALKVVDLNGQAGTPATLKPKGSESGVVSTFDDLKIAANFGKWTVMTDSMMGGKSTATMDAVAGGANGTKGAMRVAGENVKGAGFIFGGAVYSPGPGMMQGADLSDKRNITFWAKGDGKTCRLLIFTDTKGQNPTFRSFVAAPEWKQYTFSLASLSTDGHDLSGLAFLSPPGEGKFEFFLDEVEIK